MLHRDRVLANRIVSEIDIAFSMLGNTKRSVFLAHKYQTLRMEDVWETVKSDFPELRSNLLQILHNDPSDE